MPIRMLNNMFKFKGKGNKKKSDDAKADLTYVTVSLGNAQHQGKRQYQEDSFGFSDITGRNAVGKGIMAVIADGMGGLQNGKAVSTFVVSSALEWFDSKPENYTSGKDLKDIIVSINKAVCNTYNSDGKASAGSTAVLAVINGDELHWLSVGDSRLYIKRDGLVYQISEDHDYLNRLLGEVLENDTAASIAFADSQKDSLIGYIDNNELSSFDYSKKGYRLLDGDIIILCSDGVYNAVSAEEMSENIDSDAMASCKRIINLVAAKNVPGQDNNTIIVMSYK